MAGILVYLVFCCPQLYVNWKGNSGRIIQLHFPDVKTIDRSPEMWINAKPIPHIRARNQHNQATIPTPKPDEMEQRH